MQKQAINFSLFHYLKMILQTLRYGSNYKKGKYPVFIFFGKRMTAYVFFGPLILSVLPLIIYLIIAIFESEIDPKAILGFTLTALLVGGFWFILSSIFLMLTLQDRMGIIKADGTVEIHQFRQWRCSILGENVINYKGVLLEERKYNDRDMRTRHHLNIILLHENNSLSLQLNSSPGMRFKSRNKWFVEGMIENQKEWARFLGLPILKE